MPKTIDAGDTEDIDAGATTYAAGLDLDGTLQLDGTLVLDDEAPVSASGELRIDGAAASINFLPISRRNSFDVQATGEVDD